MDGLLRVSVDFDTSHLVFPILIGGVLVLLALAIVIRERRALAGSGAMWRTTFAAMDKPRFLGALALTIVYFLVMVPVGQIWPNRGFGFLICSIPYFAAVGLLFMHDRTWRSVLPLLVVAAIAPPLIWWLFSEVFFLTLP